MLECYCCHPYNVCRFSRAIFTQAQTQKHQLAHTDTQTSDTYKRTPSIGYTQHRHISQSESCVCVCHILLIGYYSGTAKHFINERLTDAVTVAVCSIESAFYIATHRRHTQIHTQTPTQFASIICSECGQWSPHSTIRMCGQSQGRHTLHGSMNTRPRSSLSNYLQMCTPLHTISDDAHAQTSPPRDNRVVWRSKRCAKKMPASHTAVLCADKTTQPRFGKQRGAEHRNTELMMMTHALWCASGTLAANPWRICWGCVVVAAAAWETKRVAHASREKRLRSGRSLRESFAEKRAKAPDVDTHAQKGATSVRAKHEVHALLSCAVACTSHMLCKGVCVRV